MQFYRDGYRPGDPDIIPAKGYGLSRPSELPAEVDVLIVGTGPAGTVLAAQLSAFPEIRTHIIERRGGPLEVGQADGVACRTVEMFQAFGLAEALLREAYWVNEVRFWGPSEEDRSRIVRTGWVEDTPEGLSEFPHVIVNQARMQQYLLEHAHQSASRLEVDYGIEFVSHTRTDGEYPIEVTVRRTEGERAGEELTVRAKYVVGCDGARSAVRRSMGVELIGDAANHAWGVIDVLADTDYPDWRTKCVIQSAGKGSLITIPREGGNMVRLYVDLGTVPAGDNSIRSTTPEQITEVANAILHPYTVNVKSVAWSSVYIVGQRVAPQFDDRTPEDPERLPHVFIAGDACHTHSAKAGQGMNVSMQDAFNLGWKLAAVLEGRADADLLRSYSDERQVVASDLIEFDRWWSEFVAQPTVDPEHPELGGVTTEELQAEFARQGRYTAGVATRYKQSSLTGGTEHQGLASGFEIGTRFHSSPVVRVADARKYELGHAHVADGRWRVYAFGDVTGEALTAFAEWMGTSPDSPIARFTPSGADVDALIDLHAIFQVGHHEVEIEKVPEILLPKTGPFAIQDWEKVWAIDPRKDIFDARGISRDGAIVIVRPDQYVSHVLPLSAREELTAHFAGVFSGAEETVSA